MEHLKWHINNGNVFYRLFEVQSRRRNCIYAGIIFAENDKSAQCTCCLLILLHRKHAELNKLFMIPHRMNRKTRIEKCSIYLFLFLRVKSSNYLHRKCRRGFV